VGSVPAGQVVRIGGHWFEPAALYAGGERQTGAGYANFTSAGAMRASVGRGGHTRDGERDGG